MPAASKQIPPDGVRVQTGEGMQKYPYIDALRGLAILGVILVHTGGRFDLPAGAFRDLVQESRFGVQLFYMVSAFTLYLSLDSRREKGFGAFFIRRFFRLAPMYWVAVFLYVIFARSAAAQNPAWAGNFQHEWRDVAANLLLLHGLLPSALNTVVFGGWSVGVEWLFYCLLPFIFLGVRNLGGALLAAGIAMGIAQLTHDPVADWLASTGMEWGLARTTQQISTFMGFYLVRQLPCFLFGIVTYYLLFPPQAKPGGNRVLTFALLLWVIILGSFATNVGPFGAKVLAPEFELCGVYLVLFVLLHRLPPASWCLAPLAYLGRLSYSMYLLHFLVLIFLTYHFIPRLSALGVLPAFFATLAVCLVLTCGVAEIARRCVERPGMNLGRLIIARCRYLAGAPAASGSAERSR
jgi:peptidoglycan/LPS O-acetylase OafA/YrhL